MELKLAIVVCQRGGEFPRAMDATTIDDHHDLFAGFAKDAYDLMDIGHVTQGGGAWSMRGVQIGLDGGVGSTGVAMALYPLSLFRLGAAERA